MITMKLKGGLGNQLFQYAMGLSTARRLNTDLVVDISSYLNDRRNRRYSLDLFPLNLDVVFGSRPTVVERGLPYDQALVDSIKDGDVLEGYFQSEKYFPKFDVRRELRSRFVPATSPSYEALLFSDKIQYAGDNSVMVGVRRTDYISFSNFHGLMDVDYYRRGIAALGVKNPTVFIFSDDTKWCEEVLAPQLGFPYYIFHGDMTTSNHLGREDVDIWLGSQCSNFVIANSTFHWWMAWLSAKFNVVAPKQWFAEPSADSRDIVPSWVQI